jgi:NAD(P)-dependent dehydrogenase (short-subunit alcohol dehydrogenase family)
MDRKHVLLFGGTGGIGVNLLSLLIQGGYFVTLAVRNISKAVALVKQYSADQQNLIELLQVDLEDEQSLKNFLLRFQSEHLEMVVFASGVRANSSSSNLNIDFTVNYVAPVEVGINLLERFPRLRVVNVTSSAAFRFKLESPKSLFIQSSSSFGGNYAKSKLALVLASGCLSRMYPDSQVVSVDPGSNRTQMTVGHDSPLILRVAARSFFSNPNVGAKRIMTVILNNDVPSGSHVNGRGKLRDLKRYDILSKYVQAEIFKGYPYMPVHF